VGIPEIGTGNKISPGCYLSQKIPSAQTGKGMGVGGRIDWGSRWVPVPVLLMKQFSAIHHPPQIAVV
jgi:hypothetical protein